MYLKSLFFGFLKPFSDDGRVKSLGDIEVSLLQKFSNDENIGCRAIPSDVILRCGHSRYQGRSGMLNLLSGM